MMKRQNKYRRTVIVVVICAIGLALLYLDGVLMIPGWQDSRRTSAEYKRLHQENQRLREDVESLKIQYMRLKRHLDTADWYFDRFNKNTGNEQPYTLAKSVDIPDGLSGEKIDIQQAYQRLVLEKDQWDGFLQDRYIGVLKTTIEPLPIGTVAVENEDNQKYFEELTDALKLHKKLIRDVRMFHDEIQFQELHSQDDAPYKAYDYKLKLDPFARESSVADAMQQALSALSAGVHQEEAVEVLDRLGDELMEPVRQAYEGLLSTDGKSDPSGYNFNIYITFGKKVMDYADALSHQTTVPLAPSAFGELDYLYRRLYQSFYDLYEIGTYESIDSVYLDMAELERTIQ